MKGTTGLVGLIAAMALISVASAGRTAIAPIPSFTSTDLTAAPGADWVGVHGNILNQQYSSLTDISKANVSTLKVAWHSVVAIPTKGKPNFTGVLAEAEPVVYQGTMYMPDAKGNIYAMDATTGERLWYYKYRPPPHFTPLLQTSRGVAIGQGQVFATQTDATVVGLDQATGRVSWHTTIGNWKSGDTMTAAPVYVNGMVITGVAGGDAGARCRVVALDAATGKVKWSFSVIPTGSQTGANTWPAKRAWVGGGAIWNTPAVDTQLGLVYVGVGNPVPYNGNVRGPGDELFTESVLALHLDTGKYAWHFQEVRHDIWDYDAAANGVELFDLSINGQTRQAIAQAGKTGWVYLLDRATGKPILGMTDKAVPQSAVQHTAATQPIPVGKPFATQCANAAAWAKWKAPDGNPVKTGCIFTPYNDQQYTAFAPSALGGADWPPTSYSPTTGDLYICSKNSDAAWKALPPVKPGKLKPLGNFFQIEGLFPAKGSPAVSPTGTVVAMDMRTNTPAWTATFPKGDMCYSGTLSTAGGVVFVGRAHGMLQAYDDSTGKLLWTSPKLAAGVSAAPMTYTANGHQYVAVYAGGNSLTASFGSVKNRSGSDLYAFALP